MSEHVSTYPYPLRPGSTLERCAPVSAEVPKLHGEALDEVVNFEHNLFAISLDPQSFPSAKEYRQSQADLGRPVESIETVWRKKLNPIELGVRYFLTPKGRERLETTLGLPQDVDTPEAMSRYLSSLDLKQVPSDVLDALQEESVGHEVDLLKQEFIDNDYRGENLRFPDIVTVYKNPEVLIEKAQQYRDLKMYLRKARADLLADPGGQSQLVEYKLMLVDMYRHRINEFLVGTYVSAHKFLGQYFASDRTTHSNIIISLQRELPAFFAREDNAAKALFLQRMDRFKRGVSVDDEGNFIWQSKEAARLVELAEQGDFKISEVGRGVYTDIDPEDLRTIEVSGQTLSKWLEAVLKEYDLLSAQAQTEWSSDRQGHAADGKWQVIVSKKFSSLKIDPKQRIIQVPDASRNLLSAIAVGSHEVTHVIQHENKRRLGKLAILNKDVNLDSSSDEDEAGGKWQEREAREIMTGQTDTDIAGTGYFKALQVKSRGGTYGECVEAYYHDARRRNPKTSPKKSALVAVKSVRRIYREGGSAFAKDNEYVTNTDPLSYLEQQLIYEGLPEDQRKLLLIGGITVHNLMRLSAVGLVDTSKIFIPTKAPWEIMYPYAKDYIAATKAK